MGEFLAIVLCKAAMSIFKELKWFVAEHLGFHVKARKGSLRKSPGVLLGVGVNLLPEGNDELSLPGDRRNNCLRRVHAVFEEDGLMSDNVAKLAGALSFASSVTLARFVRPFLQPLDGLVSGGCRRSVEMRICFSTR